jgi:hypothetical protein
MKKFRVTPDGKLTRITAAVEDEIDTIDVEDDYRPRDIDIEDSFADKLDDVVDTVEDIQDTVDSDEVKEEEINIDIENNISGHYIAECDKCKGIFISATVQSDQAVESVTGECPLCGEETEQYLKWVVTPVTEINEVSI